MVAGVRIELNHSGLMRPPGPPELFPHQIGARCCNAKCRVCNHSTQLASRKLVGAEGFSPSWFRLKGGSAYPPRSEKWSVAMDSNHQPSG
jgi:hypothetical protein